ncbi:MAG: tRNA lysidine(34) synthetase TilS, partial [Syntrophales bacterium]|nr:tRNA lysidine(34) synthetase TilS [Syntrophales bacterium]
NMSELHEALLNRITKRLLDMLSPSGKGIAFSHIAAVNHLIKEGPTTGILCLPANLRVRREYDRIYFFRYPGSPIRNSDRCNSPDFSYEIEIPGNIYIAETGKMVKLLIERSDERDRCEKITNTLSMVLMDYERIRFPLTVRNVRPGDRMQPMGMDGTKKIKSIFIDEKVPPSLRRSIPLLVDGDRDILWVCGLRTNEKVRISNHTKRVVRAEII